jgi:hypothetical protein
MRVFANPPGWSYGVRPMCTRWLSLIFAVTMAAAIAGSHGRAAESVAQADGQPANPKIGDRVRIAATAACPTPEDLARVQNLVERKDIVGADAYIAQMCLDLPAGTEFIIQSIRSGIFCGRPQGASDCLWMPQSAILQPGADSH